jgi:hypothetical protein
VRRDKAAFFQWVQGPLIAIARQWGIGELVGEVMRENEPMLQMCRELGFVITPYLSNPPLVFVRKSLELPQANGA